MTKREAKELSDRWHGLSTVCFCRDGRLCSACREQDAILERAKAAGWNIFNMTQSYPPTSEAKVDGQQ